jgi:drug/metabolite transporter (DMT)-like permease
MSFRSKMILNFAVVYFVMGAIYLAIRFSVEGFPSSLMGGIRFLVAGIILLSLSFLKGDGLPDANDWKAGILLGFVMNFCGQAPVFIASKTVPSSVIALISASVPLWMTFFDRLFFARQKLSGMTYGGLLIGFIGVLLLMAPGKQTNFNYLAALPVIFANICWALGSLLPKKVKMSPSVLKNIGTQLTSGSIFFFITSYFMGEFGKFHFTDITLKSVLALSYLIIFGSVIAFSSLNWLVRNVDAGKVSTYGFVNPLIAVLLGSMIGHEQITLKILFSAAIILVGVIIIILAKSRTPKGIIPVPEAEELKEFSHKNNL